jgi:hypothetical protein
MAMHWLVFMPDYGPGMPCRTISDPPAFKLLWGFSGLQGFRLNGQPSSL